MAVIQKIVSVLVVLFIIWVIWMLIERPGQLGNDINGIIEWFGNLLSDLFRGIGTVVDRAFRN